MSGFRQNLAALAGVMLTALELSPVVIGICAA